MATLEKVRKAISHFESLDWEIAKELETVRTKPEVQEEAQKIAPFISPVQEGAFESLDTSLALETIVLRTGRPVLTISNNAPLLTFTDVDSQVWKGKLEKASSNLLNAIPSVGRIEVKHHPLAWIGTGWLVASDIVVTNRHVAQEFGKRNGEGFVFRQLLDTPVSASIDFLREQHSEESFTFHVVKILHIEDDGGPDVAFLKIVPAGSKPLPPPLRLFTGVTAPSTDVAVIGYPAMDSRIPDFALMDRIFGSVYDFKRLAPGKVTAVAGDKVFHDCTTLGGCSGGVVLDLALGEAVGLHFAGRFLETNFAVPAPIVAELLKRVQSSSRPLFTDNKTNGVQQHQSAADNTTLLNGNAQTFTFNIPLQITVSIGTPAVTTAAQQTTVPQSTTPQPVDTTPVPDDVESEEYYTEGRPEDYEDRTGYDHNFLGSNYIVQLPMLNTTLMNDVLKYDRNGTMDHVLRYEHFSVVMSKKRRLCYFSAVNIDGEKSRKATRVGWRRDPRIPEEAQILNECYGNPPKFSRGHMTRREDPIWGRETAALRGNADSMCVTNTIPQMQSFNAPVWLGLEDYALDHAREDGMKISVFTGPIFKKNDPVIYGVKIPVSSWKIIVFIHDETGELSATAYKMSQKDHLPEEEFVFGAYDTAQTSVKTIENLTGLSFGELAEYDPLSQTEGVQGRTLTDLKQVKFK